MSTTVTEPHPTAYDNDSAGGVVVSVTSDLNDVLVTLTPPSNVPRVSIDVCCVVDVSGSMGTEATLKTESGKSESHGLNLLDVVKHAVTTVANVLNTNDRLGGRRLLDALARRSAAHVYEQAGPEERARGDRPAAARGLD
jgi:hypothetical protein